MYACVCNALTDRDVRPHTVDGGSWVSMIYRACGCGPQCNKCVPLVRQMCCASRSGFRKAQLLYSRDALARFRRRAEIMAARLMALNETAVTIIRGPQEGH